MKIAVADIAGDRLFNEADFDGLVTPDDLALLELPAYEPMDGSVFRSLPPDTTHLVTRIVDRLGEAELESLPDLQYVGLAYAGWWDKYFDRDALEA